ncbi:MAG TPA: class I SAM-dependent methyltransferase [Burkholderiales bacterium]|nr:class I SAM-dependent methyltransferase [Burkholderiales bacterium]
MKAMRLFSVVACTWFLGMGAQAQPAQNAKEFKPEVGQQGKDVVWVPTSLALVNKMLDMAKATPSDYVIDLGSGDGRTVITAAKRGIKALGIEYNPDMVELSKQSAAKEGVTERATFMKADLFETDFSQATVITMFLLPDINLKLRPKILNLKPGTRIVSNTFTMGEWDADETGTAASDEGSSYYRTALLWIVPAKVEGAWKSANGDISFKQEFQKVSGSINAGSVSTLVTGGKLRGDQISFSAGGTQYSGKVAGDTITGAAVTGGTSREWNATQVK